MLQLIKKNLSFFVLILVVIASQVIILKPHLKYGFSDVDWGFLSIYKNQNPYSISQFIDNFKTGGTRGGVYTHQIYYIGIQHDFFGLDFKSFQVTTHVFKILATLAVFPLFLAISGSSLAAFIATILFAFSHSTVGTMYTVVTSSDYSAIFSMGIFVSVYWYVVRKNSGKASWLLIVLLLLILTLFLSTERMYQLPIFIALTEAFILWQRRKLDRNTKKRVIVIFLPLFLIFLIKPIVFLDFLQHGVELVQGVAAGEWNLLLTPFIVLGSIILPHDYAKYLGTARLDNFGSFLDFLISGPLPILATATAVFGICIFKQAHIKIIQILALTLVFSVFLYIAGSHFINHKISVESITQALVGLYLLAFAIISLFSWFKTKERRLIGLFVAPILALLYILFTWIGASIIEVFSGAHRYLTIPAMLISLFWGTLFGIIFFRISSLSKKSVTLKMIAIAPAILFMMLFIKINSEEIQAFFKGQLFNGFGAEDKQLMRSQLINLTPNLSAEKPSLFYFDFSEDKDRGYYYDNTLLGGFGSWMLWHPQIDLNESISPKVFWNDPKKLRSTYEIRDNKNVFYIYDRLFEVDDFYAFKIKDRKIYDIKKDLLNKMNTEIKGE